MENCKTLNELHMELGVSRRAVQGYEKAGLVSASGKNKYGHLLYDEKAPERIARIKLFQQLGFSIKEIRTLMDAQGELVRSLQETTDTRFEVHTIILRCIFCTLNSDIHRKNITFPTISYQ